MLSPEDSRIAPLRRQAAAARVVGMCPCGCATIDFEVDRTAADPAPAGLEYAAVETSSRDQSDPEQLRNVILFVDKDGWLSSLEVVYFVGPPPPVFPEPSTLEPPWVQLQLDRPNAHRS